MMQYRRRDESSSSFLTSTKIVFSDQKYLSFAVVIAAAFWLFFSISDQLLFFSPSLAFYWPLPSSSILPFTLSTIIACLIGMAVSMNMHAHISTRNSVGSKGGRKEEERPKGGRQQ
jgi:hypothetical protein